MTNMTFQDERAQARVEGYLDEVEEALKRAGLGRSERRDVLDDLGTQIGEMLGARAAEAGRNAPDLQDVLAVITELDPPESYAEGASAAKDGAEESGRAAAPQMNSPADNVYQASAAAAAEARDAVEKKRFSILAIIGALWAPFFFVAVIFAFTAVPGGGEPIIPRWLSVTILIIGMTAPFGTTVLGLVAISQILHSGGRLYGMGLAVADALFLPALVSGAVILFVAGAAVTLILAMVTGDQLVRASTYVMFVPSLLIWAPTMIWMYRWAMKRANAPIG